eukprot:scaffold18154_cov30-Phaeocystis_antarctica.AAC.2
MEDPNYQEPEAAPQEGGASSSSASPAKKAGNKGSSSSKGSPGVDGDEGARGDTQPEMLPTVYFLNLDEEKDMRRRVEKDLSKYTDKLVRVPAVDKAQVLKCLDDGSCAKDDKAQVLGTDYLNTDPDPKPGPKPSPNPNPNPNPKDAKAQVLGTDPDPNLNLDRNPDPNSSP